MTLADRLTDFAERISLEFNGKAKKKPGLLDGVVWAENGRGTIAHRNGAALWPEECYEGMDACALSGFHLEVDVRPLVDGTLVCIHDETVERTMINISSGDVDTKTIKDWRQAKIKSPFTGYPTGTPMFFGDVLDRYGGRHLIVPELQNIAGGQPPSVVNDFIDAIKDRGLERDVLTQTSDWTTAQSLASAGLEVLYLSIEKPSESWATIKSAGVNYVGGGHNIASWSTTEIANAKTAGLTPIGFTVTTLAEAAAGWTRGWLGLFSDDPWITAGEIPYSNNMTAFTKAPPPGSLLRSSSDGSLYTTYKLKLVRGGLGINENSTAAAGLYSPCDWIPLINLPIQIDVDMYFGAAANGQTANLGIVLWKNTSDPMAFWRDAALTGQNGFTSIVRRNGEVAAWGYTNGAAASSLGTPGQIQWYGSGSTLVSKAVAEASQSGVAHVTWKITSTTFSIDVNSLGSDINKTVSYTHALNPTNMRLALRIASTDGVFKNLSVTSL